MGSVATTQRRYQCGSCGNLTDEPLIDFCAVANIVSKKVCDECFAKLNEAKAQIFKGKVTMGDLVFAPEPVRKK